MVPTVHHWPNLKTVLMVEKILSEADLTMSLEQLKRKLPKKVMDQTLRLILLYLEENGKIYIGEKGITWIYNPSPKLERAMREGIEV
ncbi:hypothetical protein A3K63_03095 [Candidatus Micrarchaeota archaeon RBG_16_49_10]|nr:MAG: hypothetical protein A3K63_03095 [Candidatus Micrarchaeota archaeon RBG_16_49_10]